MRKLLTLASVPGLFLAATLAGTGAEAATLPGSAGVSVAIDSSSLLQQADYRCRPVWRCGFGGCGWRRTCWGWRDRDDNYGYSRPYWGYRYSRPYWRHDRDDWRYRHDRDDWRYRHDRW